MARDKISREIGIIHVRAKPGHKTRGLLVAGNLVLECALGKGNKRLQTRRRRRDAFGAHAFALWLPARRQENLPSSRLRLRRVRPCDGWCDAPGDPNYNRPVQLSHKASHEDMWRKDDLYDVCIVMDWNIAPRRRGCGSAIFFHLARPGYTPTEGCIALKRADMARLLPHLTDRTVIRVLR